MYVAIPKRSSGLAGRMGCCNVAFDGDVIISMRIRNILFALSALVLIWAAVAAVIQATEKHTSTPEKVIGLVDQSPWLNGGSATDTQRRQHIDAVIASVNLLDFDQRKQMHQNDHEKWQQFMESLNKEERTRFLQETVEQHFKSMMRAFNQMSHEERQKVVDQSLKDMHRQDTDNRNMDRLQKEDEQVFHSLVEKGLSAYYQDANSDTKLDLAPLMEQMQQRMRGFPGR